MYNKDDHYNQNNYNEILYSGIIGKIFKHQHKLLTPNKLLKEKKILEIGPGFEPHIKFRKINFEEYHCLETNFTKEIQEYYRNNFKEVIFRNYDGKKVDYSDETFNRVIISHTLEHIYYPEAFINELLRVLKPNGVISIALPCDNGLLWRLGRFYNKFFNNKKKGIPDIDYDYLVANEHINSIFQLQAIIKKKFKVRNEKYLPFKIKIIDFNLIYICEIYKESIK